MIGYHKEFNWGGKGMYFKASDKKLFKKYTKLWKKISDLVGNELYNNMYYENNEKDIRHINSRISIINGEIKTTFYNNFNKNVEPKENVTYDCFSLIDLNSTNEKINDDNDYVWYPQVYLKSVNIKKRLKRKNFSIRFLNQTHLIMKLIMELIVILIVILMIIICLESLLKNLIIMNLKNPLRNSKIKNLKCLLKNLINLLMNLKLKTVF